MPLQEWSRSADYHLSVCNAATPMRSLLAYPWTRGSPTALYSTNDPQHYSPAGIPGFTQFGDQHDTTSTDAQTELKKANISAQAPAFVASAGGADGLGNVELVTLQDALRWCDDTSASVPVRLDTRRCQNIMGPPNASTEQAVASVIIEILGSGSKAADVVLKHSLINFNNKVTEELLAEKVGLTLEHIKILLKVGVQLQLYERRARTLLTLTLTAHSVAWPAHSVERTETYQAGLPVQGFLRCCGERA